MTPKVAKDEEGRPIRSGDYITFTFGIPPICVTARVYQANEELQIECIHPVDVTPKRESLANLMEWYQVWRAPNERVANIMTQQRKDAARARE